MNAVTLLVTNDFPPRTGGIQTFVAELARRQPGGSLVAYASDWPGSSAYDARLPFPVVRHRTGLLLPTPGTARRVGELARAHGATSVWFGAAAPLGLLAPALRRAGVEHAVASTHGHEVGWARLPGARQALRRVGDGVDVVTYLGAWTRERLAPAFGGHPRLERLPSGVDTVAFTPAVDGGQIRRRHRLPADAPVVVCVSRLVPRKGQDVLIRALPALRVRVPGTRLLIVGGGPDRDRLQRLVTAADVEGSVTITGSVPHAELPTYYAAGDVFAMPCRSRRDGLEVEGLGIVFLEASATGLPVVAGRSGGSPDAVLEGVTGTVVDGASVRDVARAVGDLLVDPDLARAMGAAGRAWVEREWRWDTLAARLGELLAGP